MKKLKKVVKFVIEMFYECDKYSWNRGNREVLG